MCLPEQMEKLYSNFNWRLRNSIKLWLFSVSAKAQGCIGTTELEEKDGFTDFPSNKAPNHTQCSKNRNIIRTGKI